MSDVPAVSVVMAVYNGGDGLLKTLDSLQHQTFTNFELIIIDDASTDKTWAHLSQCNLKRLRVHRNLTNRGQTASLNMALGMARGQYIARHDAEDISAPERFEKQVAYLNDHPSVALVGTQIEWVDREGEVVRRFEYPTDYPSIVKRLENKNSFGHGSVMFRREALDQIDAYRETFRLAQDYDLWLRMAEKYRAANLPEVLYRMRFSARMASVSRNTEQAAYARLARQLAAERAQCGSEQTDVDQAAQAIDRRYRRMDPISRQVERANNMVNWAERLLWWGGPSARYAWPMWTYALMACPVHPRVWKFAARQLLKSQTSTKT